VNAPEPPPAEEAGGQRRLKPTLFRGSHVALDQDAIGVFANPAGNRYRGIPIPKSDS
jgi:hypothetical protein